MKSIGMEYKYYINQNGKDERQFFSVLEQDIIRSLSSSGYDRDQIKTALLKYSPVLRNQQSDFVENYFLRQMPQNFASENKPKLPAEFAYNQEKKRHADKIVQFYLPEDRRAAIYLLDIGRKIEDIQEVLLCKSALARELPDSKMTYCDLVMEGLNQERIKRHNRLLPLAEALYLQKATAISNKYIGYQQQNLNEYQEGSIVLSMMLQSGISTDMIAEVLRKHSRNEAMKHDPDYFPRILTKCEAAKDAYLAIARADNLQPVTPPNRYRLTAKEYMSQTRSVLLNGKDEQQIILKMHTLGFNPYEIKGAILQASPVAREPGRNPEQYAEASLTVLQEEKREHALHSTKEYNLTVNLYDEKRLQLLDQQRQQRNRTYFDGKIIRELLEMKRHIPHIIKTVMEKNREQGRKTDAYVKGLIAAVQKAMRSEKAILECQKTIPEGRYTDLVRLGYTAKDMYRNAIKERVHVYPSTALDLTADFIDKDACEKLLTKYPDFDLMDLRQTLRIHSPRAQMPGMSQDYPEQVIDAVNLRIKRVREQEIRAKDVQQQYLQQCGLSNEGIEPEANMLAYHDGRAALKLLEKGVDQREIHAAIVWGAESHQENPSEYAEEILRQAKNVQQRTQDIQNYSSPHPQNAVEEYRFRLRESFDQRRYISSSIDAAIAASILLMGYQMPEIIAAVQEYSPVAAEPGRGERYGEFIADKARENIEYEQKKQQLYTPIPRLKREESAQKEYEHHVSQLQTCIQLPLTQEMDLKITRTMLKQGYNQKELIFALDQSVCARLQKNYGKQVVQLAVAADRQQERAAGREIKKSTFG